MYIQHCGGTGHTSVGLGGRCLRVQRRNARGRRAIHGPVGGRCLSGHGPEGEHALRKREVAGRPASGRRPGRERRASAGSWFDLVRADPRGRVDQRDARLGRASSRPTEDHRRSPGRPRPPAAGTCGNRYAAFLGEPPHVRKPRMLARHWTSRSRAALRCARRKHGITLSDTTTPGGRRCSPAESAECCLVRNAIARRVSPACRRGQRSGRLEGYDHDPRIDTTCFVHDSQTLRQTVFDPDRPAGPCAFGRPINVDGLFKAVEALNGVERLDVVEFWSRINHRVGVAD